MGRDLTPDIVSKLAAKFGKRAELSYIKDTLRAQNDSSLTPARAPFPFLTPRAMPSKILVWNPLFAQSHVNFMATIAKVLEEEGHDVVSSALFENCSQTVLAPRMEPEIRFDTASFKKVITVRVFDPKSAVRHD